MSWFVFLFFYDEPECLIYNSLSHCLQTYRELDRIADSERCRYGALHWTTEAVSVDAVICGGGCDSGVRETSMYFSPAVLQIWKSTAETVPLLIPVFHQVARLLLQRGHGFLLAISAVIHLRSQVAASGLNVTYFFGGRVLERSMSERHLPDPNTSRCLNKLLILDSHTLVEHPLRFA